MRKEEKFRAQKPSAGKRSQLITLRNLIIAAIVGFIIFWIGNAMADIVKESSDSEVCRLSLYSAALMEKGTASFANPTIQCEIQEKVFNKQPEEEIKRSILESFKDAVWIAGGEDPIEWGDTDYFSGKVSCLTWAVIRFEGDAKAKGMIKGMHDYAKTLKYPGRSTTFMEYFEEINKKAENDELELGVFFPDYISTDQDYYIMIRNDRSKTMVELLQGDTTLHLWGDYYLSNDPTKYTIKQIVVMVGAKTNIDYIKKCEALVN